MKLAPRVRRNILRILPFGIIWLLTGWVFLTVETAAMGTPSPDSPTIINLTFPVFLFASVAVTIVGLLVGAMETLFIARLFRHRSFLAKITYKLGLYTGMMLLVIGITFPIAADFESGRTPLDAAVWEKFGRFLGSVTFLSTMVQMASSLLLCVLYAGISEHLGHGAVVNFFTGKYHRPREEQRIFMFLDMNASTTIAEQLGHIKYFELLRAYYSDMSDGIIDHLGEVYQYVGDEVVVSWKYEDGLSNDNCVKCFFAMKKSLAQHSRFYQARFGVVPSFKGALHMGAVTTGEIGALKKEIFFTGDVLNTTARIQGMCKRYEAELLASGELVGRLTLEDGLTAKSLGQADLRGRSRTVELFALCRESETSSE